MAWVIAATAGSVPISITQLRLISYVEPTEEQGPVVTRLEHVRDGDYEQAPRRTD